MSPAVPIIVTRRGPWGGESQRDVNRAVGAGLLRATGGGIYVLNGKHSESEVDDFFCALVVSNR